MILRKLEASDVPKLREIYDRARYGFDFPDFGHSEAVYVAEEDGRIVGWAGAEKCAHVFAGIDPEWGSPGRKLELITALHQPVAKDLISSGVKYAYAFLDPRFPKFGKRLMNIGWAKRLWECFSLSADEAGKRMV